MEMGLTLSGFNFFPPRSYVLSAFHPEAPQGQEELCLAPFPTFGCRACSHTPLLAGQLPTRRSRRPPQRPTRRRRRGGAAASFNGTWRRPQPAGGGLEGPQNWAGAAPSSRASPGPGAEPHAWSRQGREPPAWGGRTRGPLAPWRRRGREPRGLRGGCAGPPPGPSSSSEGRRRLPIPVTPGGARRSLRRARRRYLAHAALVLLGHGQEHAVEAILLLRRLLRAQPHLDPAAAAASAPSRRRPPEAEGERAEARPAFASPTRQSQRAAPPFPSRIGRRALRGAGGKERARLPWQRRGLGLSRRLRGAWGGLGGARP